MFFLDFAFQRVFQGVLDLPGLKLESIVSGHPYCKSMRRFLNEFDVLVILDWVDRIVLLLSISLPLSFLHPLVQSFLSFLLPLSSFLVFRSFASFHILVFSFSPFLAFVHPFILGYFRFYITFPSNSFLSHLLLHCFVSFIISFLSSLPFSFFFFVS